MRRVSGSIVSRSPFGGAVKKAVPAGGTLKGTARRGKATIFMVKASGRQPASWSAHQPYKLAEGPEKSGGVGTPVFRVFRLETPTLRQQRRGAFYSPAFPPECRVSNCHSMRNRLNWKAKRNGMPEVQQRQRQKVRQR